MAIGQGGMQGALPLIHISSRLFGDCLVSMPFFSYGGVIANSPEARDVLLAGAVELGRKLRVSHLELRQGQFQLADGWYDRTPKVSMALNVPTDSESLLRNLSPRLRNKVRNGQKRELQVQFGGIELVKTFYAVFSASMRDLGTPTYPREWFENVCKEFPDDTKIVTIREKNQPIASGIITIYRNAVEFPWYATTQESRKSNSTLSMYWALLEWAISNGYERVDFGRCTKGSGVYEFKRQWNCEERPLHWYYWLAQGDQVPELRPDNPRFRFAINVWKRLPIGVANILGPRISCSLP
jgi:FemAB-related protein (PEP-CTERM system-associated)